MRLAYLFTFAMLLILGAGLAPPWTQIAPSAAAAVPSRADEMRAVVWTG
jgi:hypothetical protein